MSRKLCLLLITLSVGSMAAFATTSISVGIFEDLQDAWIAAGERVEAEHDVQVELYPSSEFSLQFVIRLGFRELAMFREEWLTSLGRYFTGISEVEPSLRDAGAGIAYYNGSPVGVRMASAPEWFVGIHRWPADRDATTALLAAAAGVTLSGTTVTPTGVATTPAGDKLPPGTHRQNVDGSLSALLAGTEAALGQALSTLRSFLPSQARNALDRVASLYGIPVTRSPSGETAVTVVLETRGATASTAQQVRSMGVASEAIETSSPSGLVRVDVPVSQLESFLAGVSASAYIRPPYTPHPLAVTGQGVAAIRADAFHTAGFTGAGVKVAVIDLGFSGLSSAQASGDLPYGVITNDLTGTGISTGLSHGTAVAEIVHEIAPGAELHLIKIADEVDLDLAVTYCQNSGIDVINHSLGWYNTNFYDGLGIVADIAGRAIAAGILWVNSAGNEAQRHWDGSFSDGNGDGWNDTEITFFAQGGTSIGVYMTWNEWPAASTDFDLYVIDPMGNTAGASTKYQTGIEEPTEAIFFTAAMGGSYRIRVRGAGYGQLEIFNLYQNLDSPVPSGSVLAPGNVFDVVTVGAIDVSQYTYGPLASYSSRGPGNNGVTKPDLVAPDTVSTGTSPYIPFIGTSCASPHAAGAAALLLSETPGQTAAALRGQLLASAVAMGDPNQYGRGRLELSTTAVPNQPPVAAFTLSPAAPLPGQTVSFNGGSSSDTDGYITTWQWSFGDGQIGQGAQVTHAYASPGSYPVTLTVTDDDGATDTETRSLTVSVVPNQPPVAAFTVSPAAPLPGQSVTFNGSSSSDADGYITSWEWSFGDGQVAQGSQAGHAYATSGTYTVTLTVRDNNGATDTETRSLTVAAVPNQPPVAAFTVSPAAPVPGQSVTFNGTSSSDPDGFIASWEWSFGDGQVAQGSQVGHTYTIAGTYTVTLTVRDDDSATNSSSRQLAVAVPAQADLVVDGVSVTPLQPSLGATLTFAITVRNQGTADAGFFRVRLDGASSATAGFVFSLGAGSSQTLNLSRPLSQATETFTITVDDQSQVVESNEANNTAQRTVSATVSPPIAEAAGPYAGAVGQAIAFDGTGSSGSITDYYWSFGDGASAQGATATHAYNTSGTFTATLTVVGPGGQSQDSAQVSVTPAQPALSVQLQLPKSTYQSGEAIVITYSLNRTAYLYICDVDATGKVSLVFPNYREPNNLMPAGTFNLPGASGYSILVGPPTGTETLFAFAATSPLPSFPTSYGSSFPVLSYDPTGFRNAVVQSMQSLLPSGDWAEDSLSFSVTSPAPTTGTLLLGSSPQGATISVDGVPSGTTPAQLTLAAGGHVVGLTLTGYQPASVVVTIVAGATISRTVNLTALVTNQSPVADFTYSPSAPAVGDAISFNGAASSDPDGTLVGFLWDFGDGTTASGVAPIHSFASSGSKTVALTVTDNEGATGMTSKIVSVSQPTFAEPRALWRFNEGGGMTAADASANGNNATVLGAAWTTSVDGTAALSFDGIDDRVTAPASASLNTFGTALTVEAWIQPSALGGTQRIVSQDGPSANDNRFILFTDGTNIGASVYTSRWLNATGSTPLYNGTWYHVAAVYDGNRLQVYVNGVVDGTSNARGTVGQGQAAAATTVGAKEDGSQPFAGLIDEVRIHGVAASTAFTLLPASYVPPTPTNLPPVADFTFFPTNPRVGEQVRFDSTASIDPEDGPNLSKRWRFSDGATSVGGSPRRTWDTPGTYTATLTVTDSQGLEASITKEIVVRP